MNTVMDTCKCSLLMKTVKRLNTISFKDGDITSIIKSLKPTKAHGADMIIFQSV